MPWSNQSGGGGWKRRRRQAVGRGAKARGGGGGGGGQQPDLEEILKRGQDQMKQVMPAAAACPARCCSCRDRRSDRVVAWYASSSASIPTSSASSCASASSFARSRPACTSGCPIRSRRSTAEGDAPEHHRGRACARQATAARVTTASRRARGKPDAHRRREHRRHRFRRASGASATRPNTCSTSRTPKSR